MVLCSTYNTINSTVFPSLSEQKQRLLLFLYALNSVYPGVTFVQDLLSFNMFDT